MKAWTFFLFFLIPFCSGAQTYFNRTYSVSNYQDYGDDLVKLTDGNYLVCGQSIDSASSYGVSFLKIDPVGNVMIKKNILYGYPRVSGFTSNFVAQISPSTFFCATTVMRNGKYTPIFSRHSLTSLDTLTVAFYMDTTYDMEIEQCKYISKGELICIGSKYNNANSSYLSRTLILKIDTLGHVLWKQELFANNSAGRCIEYNTVTKGFKCASNRTIALNQGNAYIIDLDSMGAITNFNTISSTYIATITNVSPGINNEFVFTGARSDSLLGGNTLDYKLMLIKTGNTGSIIFQKNYGGNCTYNGLTAASVLNDGSIITCGQYCARDTNTSLPAFYMKTSSNGDSLWSNRIFFSTSYNLASFRDVEIASDKGFIFCGYPALNSVMWVVKTDSMGCDSFPNCGISIAEQGVDNQVQIYPNPAADKVNIRIKGKEFLIKDLSLIDSYGTLIQQVNVKLEKGEIGVEKLQSGLYFVRIVLKDGRTYNQKLLILR